MKRLIITALMASTLLLGTATQQAKANNDATLGTIIGAVGGGLLGSTLGKGKGRIVATAAGTIIGAVLGNEIAQDEYERRRVIYRDKSPRYKRYPKKNKRVVRYGDDILICNKNGRHCQWYD
ncbi:glycine zipper 2TM domain-containing protein [Terasakiella sp. SH-1]|uniref:glycine zipper 2TM domain-containing protein n=1 Tax=Terasakiella sp. SH-1 TaxID=2560057 RepID=UPI0010733100|nr:glycine zipper 2TM domain-containing protein [Terasakiella sp. SH-1]